MFTLAQAPLPSTGNAKIDTIAQASALGIALASTLYGLFGKKKTPKKTTARKVSPPPSRSKVVITDEAVDELGARR